MRYFKAIQIANKPFIQWHLWANTLKQLQDMEEANNPLIIPESDIPEFVYGVCPWKIDGGELVERSPSEMGGFESEFKIKEVLDEQSGKIVKVNSSSFEFDSKLFPLDESARLLYNTIKNSGIEANVVTLTATEYMLDATNIDAFYFEMNTALINILTTK